MARSKATPSWPGPHCPEEWERDLVVRMRAVIPEREKLLVGYPAIAAHLTSIGMPCSPRTVETWRFRNGLPLKPGGRGYHHLKPTTSNFALTAWLICNPHAEGVRGAIHKWRKGQALGRDGSVIPSPPPAVAESAPTTAAA